MVIYTITYTTATTTYTTTYQLHHQLIISSPIIPYIYIYTYTKKKKKKNEKKTNILKITLADKKNLKRKTNHIITCSFTICLVL